MNSRKAKMLDISLLYVEDETEIRNAVAEALNRRVKKLYLANNGLEGFEIFKNKNPDIIITDIKMPVMDGLEMAAQIKSINKCTPIIVTTAYEESEFFHKSIEIGINNYVVKPVNMQKLWEIIEETAHRIVLEKKVNEQRQCIDSLINVRDDIVIMIESKYLNLVNKTFLDFFGFENAKEFNDKYDSILDFIKEKKELIYKPDNEKSKNWIDFILTHGEEDKALDFSEFSENNVNSEFLVTFEQLPNSEKFIIIMKKIDKSA